MSDQVVDTAPETTETAPAEVTSTVETAPVTQASLLETFRSKAPEGAPTGWLEKIKDDDSLIKTAYAAQSLIGKKGDIPAEDAPDEVRSSFWNKLGADKISALEVPDFGEEFGDMGAELKQYYGGISEKVAEIAKTVAPTAKNVPDLLNKVMETFIKEDAENVRLARIEKQKEMKEQFETVAKKFGISANDALQMQNDMINKYNLPQDMSTQEAVTTTLLTLAKETSNSNALQEAHLNNTTEGLEQQQKDAHAILMDMVKKGVTGAEYDMQLRKVRELNGKLSNLQKTS